MDEDIDLPKHINYWITTTSKHDCYFKVGPEPGPKVRIGAIKALLLAHSEVLRKMLDESPLAETGDIAVKDSDPDTFKNFLKCIYGGTDIVVRKLSFDKCIGLLYLCEKYLTLKIKEHISLLMLKLYQPLSIDQVLIGLSNPACLANPSDYLAKAISKVIKNNTEQVLNHKSFLDLDSIAVEFIVKQDPISTEEVNLWRAVLKWGQNKVGSDDHKVLKSVLRNIMKHIRFCSMNGDEFCKAVVPSKVLNPKEVFEICNSIGTKTTAKLDQLSCNNIDRKKSSTQEITFTYVLNNIKEFTGSTDSPKYKLGEFYWHLLARKNEPRKELGLFLTCSSASNKSIWRCCANFDITLVNHSGGPNLTRSVSSNEFTTGQKKDWGWSLFIDFEELVNIENGYIQNNSVEIITTVELI